MLKSIGKLKVSALLGKREEAYPLLEVAIVHASREASLYSVK